MKNDIGKAIFKNNISNNKSVYEGFWRKNLHFGDGTYTDSDGKVIEGNGIWDKGNNRRIQ